MSTLYVMVGIPASGKSTQTSKLTEKGGIIVSSDLMRAETFGDEDIQYTEEWLKEQGYEGAQDVRSKEIFGNSKMFDLAYKRCSEKLAQGLDVIFDSTACSRKARKFILDNVTNADRCICMVMAVPFDVCCKRNKMRDRTVSDSVMSRIAGNFEFPMPDEGFDEIIYCGEKSDIDYGEGKKGL